MQLTSLYTARRKATLLRKYSNIVFMNDANFDFDTVWSICHEFKNYCRIFTDGSKEGNRIAAAVVHRDNTKCVPLPDAASKFRAELYALLLAIDVVRRSNEKNFVIFSDSMSSLQSINGFNLVQKFLKDYTVLAKKMAKTLFSVGFQVMWESSVIKKADAAAKSALSLSVTRMKLPARGRKLHIRSFI